MTEGAFLLTNGFELLAFEIYLRTGRRIPAEQLAAEIEVKFNPWHDPDDGRFTFSGRGRFTPGGGSFGGGGGGASGTWEPAPKSSAKKASAPRSFRKPVVQMGSKITTTAKTASIPPLPKPGTPKPSHATSSEPRKHVVRNGYDFEMDDQKRTRHVQGEIHLTNPQTRSRGLQRGAGKPDRRPTDDGGHYVAARFGGPREAFNHFAQDSNFNRGTYRAIEDNWAKDIRNGHHVFVDIIPRYRDASKRPYRLTVTWYVDGEQFTRNLPNERKGKQND
ncbi:MAG TPA: DNA/RNA non-specific endonuclease [Sphingobium sp.]|uniref:DNA/RNA non-specific endonuclease n=1 Tax=Sphingobium sp. TaxID=1912891 RepID=UPI002ED3F126